MEFTVPRRARPTIDILTDASGRSSALTLAHGLIRALEREAAADPGGRFEAMAAPEVADAAAPLLAIVVQRLGARLTLRAQPGLDRVDIIRQ